MSSPAFSVAEYLDDETSLVLGTTLFVGKEPPKPDACVTVYDTGGNNPIDNMETAVESRQPTVQIRIRATTYASGYALAETISQKMALLLGKEGIKEAAQRADILAIGNDENQRQLFTINFDLFL